MKRFLLLFILCFMANVVFAQEVVQCKVVNKSPFFDALRDEHKYKYIGDLQPGDIITVIPYCSFDYTDLPPNIKRDFFIYFKKENVLTEKGNKKHKNDDPASNGRGLEWKTEFQRVNPFNHKEKYLGVWL